MGESLLLVAPTGIGKTYAVTGDLEDGFRKIVYAVPLRALGVGIKAAISDLQRIGRPVAPVLHHGTVQESSLFSEEVVVTTYDQVVCGAAGLPLSLPLRAGHAVAAALLMSRLIFDEVHLAWAISDQALTILLAIVDLRRKLGLQTVVLTATLPSAVAELIAQRLRLRLITVGQGEVAEDEALQLREDNRRVKILLQRLQNKGGPDNKRLDWSPIDGRLEVSGGKRIYFANTVGRIQETYDRLILNGVDPSRISVLHNRMPASWRTEVEERVHQRFGKESPDGDWVLLTNQVAEAGLDISAPLVISDPAPVDTLVQRAGRCARWFRSGNAEGEFIVISAPKAEIGDRNRGLALPYRRDRVQDALDSIPSSTLTWQVERQWIDTAWGGGPNSATGAVQRFLDQADFALNLFDRAAQEHRPGEIATVFREILSVDVAVEDTSSRRSLQSLLASGQRPDTSSVSLGQGRRLLRAAGGKARVIRYEEGDIQIKLADRLQPGDVIVVPSTVGYLHKVKGLCLDDSPPGRGDKDVVLSSEWKPTLSVNGDSRQETGRRQTLFDHVKGVMEGVHRRLMLDGAYLSTLLTILKSLEPEKDAGRLAAAIAQIATLAAGFHDLGKADYRWQSRARAIDPGCSDDLVGRTLNRGLHIGIPHTPPGYSATLKACSLLIGSSESSEHLIRSIALAAVRHHSSLLNPASVEWQFEPDPKAPAFVKAILQEIGAPDSVVDCACDVLGAAQKVPARDAIPLTLPNDDLFPVYALVGRAVLMADREDAAGKELEKWRAEP